MKRAHFALLSALMLLAGCASPLAGKVGTDGAALSVVTAVRDGEFRTQVAGFQPYTKASINHLVLKLYTLTGQAQNVETPVMSGGAQVQADLASAVIDQPVTFKNLRNDTKYRIKAFAYKATGTATGDLISTEDAASYRDVIVGASLTPTIASIPVRLIDRLFKAGASGSVVVTDGQFTYEGETISLAPASVQSFSLTIAGTYSNFTLNGLATANTYSGYYRPATSQATASVLVTNSSNSDWFFVSDQNQYSYLWLQPGATGSLTAYASNGSLNIYVDSGP